MTRLKPLAIGVLFVTLLGCQNTTPSNQEAPLSPTKDDTYSSLINTSSQSDLAYEIVKSLTVEVGPRIAGSKGDKRAVAWAETKFAELGFDKFIKNRFAYVIGSEDLLMQRLSPPFHKA